MADITREQFNKLKVLMAKNYLIDLFDECPEVLEQIVLMGWRGFENWPEEELGKYVKENCVEPNTKK